MSYCKEGQGQTRDKLERLHLSAGLGTLCVSPDQLKELAGKRETSADKLQKNGSMDRQLNGWILYFSRNKILHNFNRQCNPNDTAKIIKTAVRFPTSEISIINGCNDKSIYLITKELKPLSHCEIAFHIKRENTCQVFFRFLGQVKC